LLPLDASPNREKSGYWRAIMNAKLACLVMSGFVTTYLLGAPPSKPRVFIAETTAPQVSGDASVGDAQGSLALTGGNSAQSVEVMRAFGRYCPAVVITSNRDKADFLVQFDHEAINPTTPFTHGNKVAVFNKNEDLVYSNATRILSTAVKGACAAIGTQDVAVSRITTKR
jgi:hypothetical protein